MTAITDRLTAEGVLWLTLNRPDRLNSINDDMSRMLTAHIRRAADDQLVRCVVLTGAGRAFCAGGDVSTMGLRDGATAVGRLRDRARLVGALSALPKPLVAAVNGPAVGGGFALALTADVIIADPSAYFQLAFVNLGLSPDMGTTFHLPRQIGTRRALNMALTDQRIHAVEARKLGLVAQVSPPGDIFAVTDDLTTRLAGLSPHALAATKQMLRGSLDRDLDTALEIEALAYGVAVGTEHHHAAVEQFRKAHYRG